MSREPTWTELDDLYETLDQAAHWEQRAQELHADNHKLMLWNEQLQTSMDGMQDTVTELRAEVARLKRERLHWEHQNGLLEDDIERLRAALSKIASIENQDWGPDWEEIEEARKIANAALDTKP